MKKASGETEQYDPNKVIRSCVNAGLSEGEARRVEEEARRSLYGGITTKEIYAHVRSALERVKREASIRYGLKKAIMRLGPAGFTFETYFAEILKNCGYVAQLRRKIRGACVTHEIDVVAEQTADNGLTRTLVECKYHNAPGIFTGLKEALYTYARFLDLNEGNKLGLCESFDSVWLVSNTKCSEDAQAYCNCKKIRLIAWNCPPNNGLERMIEAKSLYPLTILESVSPRALTQFAQAGMVLVNDVEAINIHELKRRTKLSLHLLEKIKEEAARIGS